MHTKMTSSNWRRQIKKAKAGRGRSWRRKDRVSIGVRSAAAKKKKETKRPTLRRVKTNMINVDVESAQLFGIDKGPSIQQLTHRAPALVLYLPSELFLMTS